MIKPKLLIQRKWRNSNNLRLGEAISQKVKRANKLKKKSCLITILYSKKFSHKQVSVSSFNGYHFSVFQLSST